MKNLPKISVLVVMSFCMSMNLYSQKSIDFTNFDKQWKSKKITNVKDGKISTLITSFCKTWSSDSGDAIVEYIKNPAKYARDNADNEFIYDITLDVNNGYVSAFNGSDMDYISACVWKRNNGHRLLGVVVGQPTDPHVEYLCFYDYNPATSMLTPENISLPMPATSTVATTDVSYELPRVGKELVVSELVYHWQRSLTHHFSFDGMKPKFMKTEIEDFNPIYNEYADNAVYSVNATEFCKYAIIDVDNDLKPELWIADNSNDNNGAVFAFNDGKPQWLGDQNFKYHLEFFPNVVLTAGGCGTGCYYRNYSVIKGSQVDYVLNCYETHMFDGDKEIDEYEYSIGEKELTKEEGERVVNGFGQSKEIRPFWYKLGH